MCRFMVYLGTPALLADLVTKPSHSLTRQSYNAKERLTAQGHLNGDGFGIGWYPPDAIHQKDAAPCVFTSIQPAWNNHNLERLANTIVSPLIFAHVRAAYPGIPVSDSNCQPFVYGRYMWMHNGGVGGFHEVRRKLLSLLSDEIFKICPSFESDSAICFSLFLEEIKDKKGQLSPQELVVHMRSTICRISEVCREAGVDQEQSLLNFVVSDGLTVVASRYTDKIGQCGASLYYASGTSFERVDGTENRYRVRHAEKRAQLGMVASEPLTEDKSDWIRVPPNRMVVMSRYKGNVVDLHIVPVESKIHVDREIFESFSQLSQPLPPPPDVATSASAPRQHLLTTPSHCFHGSDSDGSRAGTRPDPVTSLGVSGGRIFAGKQSGYVSVYDLDDPEKCHVSIRAHDQSVFALAVSKSTESTESTAESKCTGQGTSHDYLFSYSTTSVRQWDLASLAPVARLADPDADVLDLAISHQISKSTPIISCCKPTAMNPGLSQPCPRCGTTSTVEIVPGCRNEPNFPLPERRGGEEESLSLNITDTQYSGHSSRVYALAICHPFLLSGSGDSFIKAWDLESGDHKCTLKGHKGSVLCLMAVQVTKEGVDTWQLFSGSRDNSIKIWDISTFSSVTSLKGHTDDVTGLANGFRGEFYSASSDGTVRLWSRETLECLQIFSLEGSIFLSIAAIRDGFVTGSSDGVVRYWVPEPFIASPESGQLEESFRSQLERVPSSLDSVHVLMEKILQKFLRLKTVTGPSSQSQLAMWQGARFLENLIEDLGGEGRIVPGEEGISPVVLGRFQNDPSKLKIVICGHYDVSEADPSQWRSNPFDLTAENGQLYGRGVSDNKGPTIATLFAVKELIEANELKVNLVFVFDGMHESGGKGLEKAIKSNFDWFEETGLILSNSGSWISDHRPCLIYGMRGLICLEVSISGPKKDLHSGKDGGVFVEPLIAMMTVLSNLVDSQNKILIPGFYDDILQEDKAESCLYHGIEFDLEEYKRSSGLTELTAGTPGEALRARWCHPSLSVVKIDSPTDSWSTVPRKCTAKVTIRHVPEQNPRRLVELFQTYVEDQFKQFSSTGNSISVEEVHIGDSWIGDPQSDVYQTAAEVIEKEWGAPPMYIREGQTISVIPYLEKTLATTATLMLPFSQATDYMAQNNEKLTWKNFIKGKDTMKGLLRRLGED